MYVLAGVTYFPATFCESTETVHTVSDMDPHGKSSLDFFHPVSSLDWEEWPSLPVGMRDARVLCLNGRVYIGGGMTSGSERNDARLYSLVFQMESTWTVTDTPTFGYALSEHKSQLLLVGGHEFSSSKVTDLTDKIFTLLDDTFVENLPPMKEKRWAPCAVSIDSALVVAGGWGTSGYLSSVEVFRDGQWVFGPSLPRAGCDISSCLFGPHWYLIGWDGNVFRLPLDFLESAVDCKWKALPDTPSSLSAAVPFGDHFLSIGGGEYSECTSAIHALSSSSQSWEYVANLPVPLSSLCATLLPTGELVVIGGESEDSCLSDRVFSTTTKSLLNVLDFNISQIFQLHRHGIKLIEILSRDRYHFHVAVDVQLSHEDKCRAHALPPKDYVELIFQSWERSEQPTYPPTWEGLFTVLRKMDLGHLVEGIVKSVTGPTTDFEIESSPQVSEEDGPAEEKEIDLVTRSDAELSVKSELRLRMENAMLNRINKDLSQENELLKEEIMQQRSENDLLRATRQSNAVAENEPQSDLPGVEVVGRTTVVITNSAQSFYWTGYGFKLYTPPGSLPDGVDHCVLYITVSLAGQYKLPDGQELVSAIFWVRHDPTCRFKQKLTVEIQHCAKITSSTKLTFVRAVCSQKSLPYTFKKLEGQGSFSGQSSYGCLEVNHFSGLGITAEEDVDKSYIASLWYKCRNPRLLELYFVITWDHEVHHTETQKYFKQIGAEERAYLDVEFEDETISLNIPMPAGTEVNEWKLTPLIRPKVTRKRVDSFMLKGKSKVPSCQLRATMSTVGYVPECSHLVTLEGAKGPDNEMLFVFDAVGIPNGSSAKSIEHLMSLDQLLEHVGVSKDSLDQECSDKLLREMATHLPNWLKYARALGLTEPQITGVKSDPLLDNEMKPQEVLRLWKKANAYSATYSILVEVCLSQGDSDVAKRICEIVKREVPSLDQPEVPSLDQPDSH